MPKNFGTDGLRGKVGVFLTPLIAYKVGKFLGKKSSKGKILIGKDTRISSDMLELSIASGILSSGVNSFLLGVVSTPVIPFLLKNFEYDFGIMISASHNSYEDNGIKIFNQYGLKIEQGLEKEIENIINNFQEDDSQIGQDIGKYFLLPNLALNYIQYLLNTFKIVNDNLKIVADCSNGSTYQLAQQLFQGLGIKYRLIANEPNGININENCGSVNISNLLKNIDKDEIGFSYDGDGDRIIAVINGNVLNGDEIIFLLANYLKTKNKLRGNKVVLTAMSNIGIIESLSRCSIETITTSVGDKNVQMEMIKNNLSLGGEQSGHIIAGDYLMTGDCLITTCLLLEAITNCPKIVNLLEDIEYYHQELKSILIKDKNEIISDHTLAKMITDDNNFLEKYGRVYIRASGTENKVRILVETKDEKLTKDLMMKYLKYFKY